MSNFVDKVRITAKAGNGGNGSASFHREKFVINGGPDGGDGGNGGNVCFLADPNMHTLLDFRFRSKYSAENGEDGLSNRRTGKSGKDLIIKVPSGTVIKDTDTGRIIADMDTPGKTKIILRGGKGGWGNQHFATSVRQAPNFAKPGIRTEIRYLTLELKTIADIGLIGYPNVGKSSILSVLTSARPKVANYHFTTLSPNLGIVRHNGEDIVIADIPGIIEGAAEGAGLGHSFLRHVERTRLLLHVVDISGTEGRDPVEDYKTICLELEKYGDLTDKPQIIVCNKMDIPEAKKNLERFMKMPEINGLSVFPVSVYMRDGFDNLLDAVAEKMKELPPPVHFEAEEEPEPDDTARNELRIVFDGATYFVTGGGTERLVESVNFEDPDSLNWFHKTLRRTGVIQKLRDAGAKEGSVVDIYGMEFDFVD